MTAVSGSGPAYVFHLVEALAAAGAAAGLPADVALRLARATVEGSGELMFRDAQTMELKNSLVVDCRGVDHMDFTADGRFLIASCEFSGVVLKVDVAAQKVVGKLLIDPKAMPQDVKTSPDGKVFYVADMMSNGVHLVEPDSFTKIGFIPTGKGAHGLYVSRDSKVMYVSNRGEGSVSLIELATRKVSRLPMRARSGESSLRSFQALDQCLR